jgi:hypothetical protein
MATAQGVAKKGLQIRNLFCPTPTPARAKDATQLHKAISTKLKHQAAYAVWRQNVVRLGGDRKLKLQFCNFDRPDADPGAVVVHRWRL